jgi:hypothetical protein
MDIEVNQRYLGEVDIEALRRVILSQTESAWAEQSVRQRNYDVHQDTESLVMLFCDESWPQGEIYRDSGWRRLCAEAMPIIDYIIANHYVPGGTLLRAMAAKLKPQGRIQPHIDTLKSFHLGHRIHVPITTNPGVRFTIDGRPYAFDVGKAYEINNQKTHSVMNMSDEDRITFIFDYVPASSSRQDT